MMAIFLVLVIIQLIQLSLMQSHWNQKVSMFPASSTRKFYTKYCDASASFYAYKTGKRLLVVTEDG